MVIFPVLGLSLLRRGEAPLGRVGGARPSAAMPVLNVEDRVICGGC